MPIQTNFTPDGTGIIVKMTGKVSAEELISVNQEVAECLECVFQLWDMTEVEHLGLSSKDIHTLSIQDGDIPEHAKLEKVALVGTQKVLHGLDEIYHTFSEKWVGRRKDFKSRSFTSLDDAFQWVQGKPSK